MLELERELAEARAAVLAAEQVAADAPERLDPETAEGRIAILEEALFKLQLRARAAAAGRRRRGRR